VAALGVLSVGPEADPDPELLVDGLGVGVLWPPLVGADNVRGGLP
jgi:hypothetical protein